MILSGCAVQRNGLGSWLASSRYRLIAAWRSTTDRKTPRFKRRLVSVAKKVSTALSQEHEVGVKWKVKRGWRGRARQSPRLFVGGVVVEGDVDDLAGRDRGRDGVEEADELLVRVAL